MKGSPLFRRMSLCPSAATVKAFFISRESPSLRMGFAFRKKRRQRFMISRFSTSASIAPTIFLVQCPLTSIAQLRCVRRVFCRPTSHLLWLPTAPLLSHTNECVARENPQFAEKEFLPRFLFLRQ